jgi:hypothetical protein
MYIPLLFSSFVCIHARQRGAYGNEGQTSWQLHTNMHQRAHLCTLSGRYGDIDNCSSNGTYIGRAAAKKSGPSPPISVRTASPTRSNRPLTPRSTQRIRLSKPPSTPAKEDKKERSPPRRPKTYEYILT